MKLIGGGGRESTNLLGMLNLPWKGFEKKNFTKIEAHAGMAERLVIDLTIEEALQEEIKHTLEHNNQSYGDWCALSDKDKKNKVKLTVTYTMGWQKRSPAGGSLLPAHVVCHGKFNLVVVFSLSDRAHQSPYDQFLCSSVWFMSS